MILYMSSVNLPALCWARLARIKNVLDSDELYNAVHCTRRLYAAP